MNKTEKRIAQKNKVKNDIQSLRKSFWKYSLNFVIILISVFAIGLMSALIFQFDFKYLLEPPFIITSILLSMIYATTHWSSYNARVKKLRENLDNQEKLIDNENEIKETTNTITWQERKSEFITFRNQKEKIEAWKIYINNALTKLSNKTKQKHKELEDRVISDLERKYLDEEKLKKLELKLDKKKRKSKYIARKKELNNLLSDEWIFSNLDRINIDYNKIDAQFIEVGDTYQNVNKDKANTKGKYLKDNGWQRILILVLTLFISSFTSSLILDGFNAQAIFDLITRLLVLFVNILTGTNYGDIYYYEVDVHNSNARVRIANEFVVWNKNNPKKVEVKE